MRSVRNFRGLTGRRRAVFEQIAAGNDSRIDRRLGLALIATGLVEAADEHHGPMTFWRYQIPLDVHIAWCSWCSEQFPECLTCDGFGEHASGKIDEDGDELPPVLCEACGGTGEARRPVAQAKR